MCSKSQKGQNPTLKASIPDQLKTIIPWVFERGRKFPSSGYVVLNLGIQRKIFLFACLFVIEAINTVSWLQCLLDKRKKLIMISNKGSFLAESLILSRKFKFPAYNSKQLNKTFCSK